MSKRHAPATARNREAIAEVLQQWLPGRGRVLEVASGTGEHALFFAARFPELQWQPTDISDAALASIEAHRAETGGDNVLAAQRFDVTGETAPVADADAIVCINMIHIAPFAACEGLFRHAQRLLTGPHAPLITYGPYRFHGEFLAPSNAEFDASLRQRNPAWGVRDLDDVERTAQSWGFKLAEARALPANNHCLVFIGAAS